MGVYSKYDNNNRYTTYSPVYIYENISVGYP